MRISERGEGIIHTTKEGEAIPHAKMQVFPLPIMIMMKKYANKVLAAAMAAVMMVSVGGVNVLAQDVSNVDTPSTATTNVKYEVTAEYTWSVPTEIDFTNNATVTTNGTTGATQNVQVTKNVIPNGKKVHIILAQANTFKITSTEGAELTYKVSKAGTELNAGEMVLDVNAGTNSGSTELTFTLTKDTVEKAGTYTGTVTYTSSVENQ